MFMKYMTPFVLGMFACASPLAAPSKQAMDEVFSRFVAPSAPGCAVAVLEGGEPRYVQGYGMANLEHRVAIQADQTVFDIGSASKQFTAAAVLLLVGDGKLSLDQDIRTFFPKLDVLIPPITIKQLLVHTSGLRDYAALMDLQGFYPEDATTPVDAMRAILAQSTLEFAPGERHAYSNTNYFLLGQIVAKVAGKSLAQFARERIFQPLGMHHTSIRDDHMRLIAHRASAYDDLGGGEYAIDMGNSTISGDGLVHTTVTDLAQWDENFYTHRVGGLWLHQQMLTPGRLNNGAPLHYALGGLYLDTYRGENIVYHRGANTGYRAQLLRFPDRHFSVATLCNVDNSRPAVLSEKVADLWLAGKLAPAPQTQQGLLRQVQQADRFVGMYWSKEDASINRVTLNDGKLWYMDRFNASFEVAQAEDGSFWLKDKLPLTQLKFTSLPDNTVRGMAVSGSVVGGEGQFINFERVTPAPPTSAELTQYVGHYFNKELGVRWTIAMQSDKLTLSFFRNPGRVLTPLFADAFRGLGMIRFERDSRRKVIGLLVDYNWLKSLHFVREDIVDAPKAATMPRR